MGMMQASHSTEWPETFHQMLFKVAVTFFAASLHAFISLDFASLFCPLNFAVQLNYWCDLSRGRDSGNDFGHFSVSFFEGRISYIRAACNYPTRNANFKSWISDIRLQSVSFLVFQILCLITL